MTEEEAKLADQGKGSKKNIKKRKKKKSDSKRGGEIIF